MRNTLKKAEIISFIIACILGVIFHFIYEWSGKNAAAALFFPVNESTWEHLKLIFFPILILSAAEYISFRIQYKNFICGKFLSVLIGMGITIVLFYTYIGVYGKNVDVINIIIYFIAMAAAYVFSYRFIHSNKTTGCSPVICCIGFIILLLLFMLFSKFPPPIGLFVSP